MVCIQDDSVITGGNKVVACMDDYLRHTDDYNLKSSCVCQRGGAHQYESWLVCGAIMNPVPCSGSTGPES